MSDSMTGKRCEICGRELPCTTVPFYPTASGAAPAPYAGTRGIEVPNQFYLSCCEDCGREKGEVPKTAWILTLIGCLLFYGSIVLVSLPKSVSGISPSAAWPVAPMMIGWALTVFAPLALILKMRYESSNGKLGLLIFLQFIPVIGLIALLANARKINRCYRAVSALKPVAVSHLEQEKQKGEEMARLAERGEAMTEEQKKQVEEYEKEKEFREKMEESAREARQEQVNRSNYRGAILGIVFTVIIAIIGISTYSSGRGYMTFFGMKLSSGGFAALIAAFLIWDVIAIVSAKKKK